MVYFLTAETIVMRAAHNMIVATTNHRRAGAPHARLICGPRWNHKSERAFTPEQQFGYLSKELKFGYAFKRTKEQKTNTFYVLKNV